jgi:hypothetical protein
MKIKQLRVKKNDMAALFLRAKRQDLTITKLFRCDISQNFFVVIVKN